ncbi:serine/threonine-protein kinase [Streptomyces sp. NRRL F-5123]|uniref:serine/threonine-protein kinase n=1 Tax=Streptomyces sp. NRRL F-5123 TaxID=1463856 RepID=UPI0004E230CB|nr:serine/threonine-protein kinase [Streptomyces sp. NRRL F-5123]
MTSTHGGDGEAERDGLDGAVEPLIPADPARIGPYLLLGRLGAGGMGRVYLARSEGGRTVAVKVVHEEHLSDPAFKARFRREIDAARRVGERYTAPVLDADPDAALPWVATGYVPGLSLDEVVREHGPLPAASVRALAGRLLHALQDIHAAGIVHRDLKPSNVMLTAGGPKVIDFGIARAVQTTVESLLTSTGMVLGSPGFMSPEQVRGQDVGPKSDVFSLGSVLMYAATGSLPFGAGAGNHHAVMFRVVEEEPALDGVQDGDLRALIARCLQKKVELRPSVAELLTDPERTVVLGDDRAWLPAPVLARIAERSARLLEADAAPVRQPGAAPTLVAPEHPAAAPGGTRPEAGDKEKEEERKDRRRRTRFLAVPVVLVLGAGTGTLVMLQPFSSDSRDSAAPPSRSAGPSSGTTRPLPADAPSATRGSGSPAPPGTQTAKASASTPPAAGSSAPAKAGSGGRTSTGGASEGSSTAGSTGSGGSSGSSSGSASSGSTTSGSGSTGSSGSSGSTGSKVPTAFVGGWTYGDTFNVGQPATITFTSAGTVRLTELPVSGCSYTAQVTSTANGGSRVDVGPAQADSHSSPICASLAASYFAVSGSGIRHYTGDGVTNGYYYQRS